MTSFRFVHTADTHIDSPLRGLAGQQGAAADRIRRATRDAFDNLISQAIDAAVSFVIIAGDIYDGDWRDYQTGLFFVGEMGRLNKAGIPAFLLYGNHDAESKITRHLSLPENVSAFSAMKPQTFELKELRVALHGQSFRQRDTTEDFVPAYPGPTPGMFNVGVLHTGLGGMGGHANYAPCTLEELISKGYDYWALGHVHQGCILHERPFVVFPGALQGRHIREAGPKGAYLVTVEEGEVTELAQLQADTVRWALVHVSLGGCERMADVAEGIRGAIEEAAENCGDGQLVAMRVELDGRTDLHGELLASTEWVLAEARAAAAGLGEEAAWVERVMFSTEPSAENEAARGREDAVGELQRLLADASKDADLLEQLRADIGEFVGRLPHEIRATSDDTLIEAAVGGAYADLIGIMEDYLTARITSETE
ncbi:MAG: DNA repair exonuclease [Coriobacteriia bacterium]|nr:DNA repair exonuclease [Coriobacteriia bacterium]